MSIRPWCWRPCKQTWCSWMCWACAAGRSLSAPVGKDRDNCPPPTVCLLIDNQHTEICQLARIVVFLTPTYKHTNVHNCRLYMCQWRHTESDILNCKNHEQWYYFCSTSQMSTCCLSHIGINWKMSSQKAGLSILHSDWQLDWDRKKKWLYI